MTITEQALRVRRHQRRLGVVSPPDLISITGQARAYGLTDAAELTRSRRHGARPSGQVAENRWPL